MHGYGTTSRFLTDELRATLQERERRRRSLSPIDAALAETGPIDVSVDALWR